MWYGKYENYTNDDWRDNISPKTKQIALEDIKNH